MKVEGALLLCVAVLVSLLGASCNSTAPSPSGLAGNWSGTTVQGEAIAFTVSADEKVTSIDLGYSFNGCSGSKSFSSLSLETAPNVTCIPGPCPAAVSSYRAFYFFEGGTTFDAPSTTVNGFFPAPGRASGTLNLANYEGCGTARGVGWNATRR